MLECNECEDCDGRGKFGNEASDPVNVERCGNCDGQGYTDLTPCCGCGLVDEADAVDDAYERGRAEGWGK